MIVSNSDLANVYTELWKMDENGCSPGGCYELNMQGYISSSYSNSDYSKEKLFLRFNHEEIISKPTFRLFFNLLDNYENLVGVAEEFTQVEKRETWMFIDAISETNVMKHAHKFLIDKNLAPKEKSDFKKLLFDIWFALYRRNYESKNRDSCGFEHVFVGETKEECVIGLHNWIQFYLLEKQGKVNYHGFYHKGTSNENNPRFVTIQFSSTGAKMTIKSKGGMFMGTSPEFEMAIYTLTFLCKNFESDSANEEIPVLIDGNRVTIICHKIAGNKIGTCFPKFYD